jgi:hypothetical protein
VIEEPSGSPLELQNEIFHSCNRSRRIPSEGGQGHGNVSAETDIDVTPGDAGAFVIIAGVGELAGGFLNKVHVEGMALLPALDYLWLALSGGGMG